MSRDFTSQEILKHRIQMALLVHGVTEEAVAEHLGISRGHLQHVLYYNRPSGRERIFAGLSDLLGFDPRYGISPEVRSYLNTLASPPRKEAGSVSQGQ